MPKYSGYDEPRYHAELRAPSQTNSRESAYSQSITGRSRVSNSSSLSNSTELSANVANFMFPPGEVRVYEGVRVKSLYFDSTSRGKDPNYPDQVPPTQRQYLGHSDDDKYSMVGVRREVGPNTQFHYFARPAKTGPKGTGRGSSQTTNAKQKRLPPIDEGQDSSVKKRARNVSTEAGSQCSKTNDADSEWGGTVVPDDSISQMSSQGDSQRGGTRPGSLNGPRCVSAIAPNWSWLSADNYRSSVRRDLLFQEKRNSAVGSRKSRVSYVDSNRRALVRPRN